MSLTTTDRLALVARIVKVAPTVNAVTSVAETADWKMSSNVYHFETTDHGKSAPSLTAMLLVTNAERMGKLTELIAVIASLENVT